MEKQKTQYSHLINEKKNKIGGLTPSDLNYKTTVMKTLQCQQNKTKQNKKDGQMNGK